MKPSIIMGILLLVAVTTALFNVEQQAEFLRDQMEETQRQIVENKREIHTLKAEWAYLSHPKRIREMSQRYLTVGDISAQQLAAIDSIDVKTQVVAVNERNF